MTSIRRSIASVILTTALAAFGTAPALASLTINGPAAGNHLHQLKLADGDTVTLIPDPVTYIDQATAAMQAALAAQFSTWNFTFNQGGLAGTININQYKATSLGPHNGGGLIDLTYTRAESDPLIEHLFWIQLVTTNRPSGGTTSPYIDPRPNDDSLPFYYTLPQDTQPGNGDKTASTYHFADNSRRDAKLHPELITWRGDLMLASWTDNNTFDVTVYDGIRWGWNFQTVPEPGTLALLLGAALLLVLQRRRAPRCVQRD